MRTPQPRTVPAGTPFVPLDTAGVHVDRGALGRVANAPVSDGTCYTWNDTPHHIRHTDTRGPESRDWAFHPTDHDQD